MSAPTGEPMFPADYGSEQMTSERLCCWDAVAVAADPKAVHACLKEYMFREMKEQGIAAGLLAARLLVSRAEMDAILEHTDAVTAKVKGA